MIIQSAMDWAIRRKIPPEVIAHVYTKPEYTYTDPVHEENERRVRDDWCLVVDPEGVILSIIPAESAQLPIEEVKDIKLPKAKGGKGGNLYPTSFGELIALLKERGYRVEDSGSGHKNIYDCDDHSRLVYVLPSSASDYRSLRNGIAGLKKSGVYIRRSA
jgi:hypothetical protein